MRHTPILFKILLLLLGVCTSSTAQNRPSNADRGVINAHIEYVNLCTNYVEAVTLRLGNLNSDLNDYYKRASLEGAEKYLKPFEVRFEGAPAPYKIFPEALSVKHAALIASQKTLAAPIRPKITTALNFYQKDFRLLLNAVDSIKSISRNPELFFKDPEFTSVYERVHSIETRIAIFTEQNDIFFDLTQQLFGREELPVVLQRTKDITFLVKKMKQQLRSAQKEQLRSTLAQFEKIIAIRETADDLKALEYFGDFDYYDNDNSQNRANIERGTRWLVKVFEDYLANEPPPCGWFFLKRYDAHYCWVNRINDFHDATGTTTGRYNAYMKRANVPILYVVEEVQPFRLLLPEGKAPFPEETTPVVLEIDTESETGPTEEAQKDSLVEKPIEKPVFKKDDVTTLDGSKTNNLVLLLDVSASMRLNNNGDKLKKSINHLIDLLRTEDKLTVISYAGTPKKIIDTSSDYNKEELKEIINELQSEGNTSAKPALKMAYAICRSQFVRDGNNRIIIASDGDFKVDKTLKKQIQVQAKNGVFLSTFHFISEKLSSIKTLKTLSKLGNGSYQRIESENDAVTILVSESKQRN